MTANEAAGTETFTVTLSGATELTTTVDFATANGTALAGTDFTAAAGTLTFAPGVTTQTIAVPILDDATLENQKTFTVSLSNPSNATFADAQGLAPIHI